MKIKILTLFLWFVLVNYSSANEEADDNDESSIKKTNLQSTLDILTKNIENDEIDVSTEISALLNKIKGIVSTSFFAIDEQSIAKNWREGLAVDRNLDFERTITYYQLKTVYDYPCKSIDFLFNIKGDFAAYEFNVKRFMLCFLRYFDLEIKEYLSDIVVEGGINVMKSGYVNPVSTFFSNILIIEGPLKLKEELFAAIYKYVDTQPQYNGVFKELIDCLIKLSYDKVQYQDELIKFLKVKSTTLLFFFYDIIITYLKDNDVYLSAYDYIQPDSTMITNPESMNPKDISQNFRAALEKDLNKFKQLRDNFQERPSSTIYHKAYVKFIADNIKTLCKFFYGNEDC